jgi:hypothetical protein
MIAWLFVDLARAGLVFDEPVDLETVLSWSVAVAVVRLEAPATRPAKIPVPSAGERSCGTYDFGVYRVEVVEVLLAPAEPLSLKAGQEINVFFANTGDLVDLTHLHCAEGISKSPIFQSFPGDPTADGAKMIVFLGWEAPYGWTEAVGGSWLAAKQKKAIVEKLRERAPATVSEAPGPLLCVTDADCAAGACSDMRCAPRE